MDKHSLHGNTKVDVKVAETIGTSFLGLLCLILLLEVLRSQRRIRELLEEKMK